MQEKTFGEAIKSIKDRQSTIDVLLNIGAIINKGDHRLTFEDVKSEYEKKWKIETFYNAGDCSIGFASCDDMAGVFPDHVHNGVTEYLICVQGSMIETFGIGGSLGMRIVRIGECVAVPPGMIHSSKPLENNTKLAFICVPSDITIPMPEEIK